MKYISVITCLLLSGCDPSLWFGLSAGLTAKDRANKKDYRQFCLSYPYQRDKDWRDMCQVACTKYPEPMPNWNQEKTEKWKGICNTYKDENKD